MRHLHRQRLRPPGLIPTKWAMARAMEYCAGSKDSDERYLVPKGFPFDGASVPILLTILVPRSHSSYLGAAALHDHLYQNRRDTVPRNRADELFREAMMVLGLHWFWAMILWRGVRAGGWVVSRGEVPLLRKMGLPLCCCLGLRALGGRLHARFAESETIPSRRKSHCGTRLWLTKTGEISLRVNRLDAYGTYCSPL